MQVPTVADALLITFQAFQSPAAALLNDPAGRADWPKGHVPSGQVVQNPDNKCMASSLSDLGSVDPVQSKKEKYIH